MKTSYHTSLMFSYKKNVNNCSPKNYLHFFIYIYHNIMCIRLLWLELCFPYCTDVDFIFTKNMDFWRPRQGLSLDFPVQLN